MNHLDEAMSHALNIILILFWLGIGPGIVCYCALCISSFCSRAEEYLADQSTAKSAPNVEVTR